MDVALVDSLVSFICSSPELLLHNDLIIEFNVWWKSNYPNMLDIITQNRLHMRMNHSWVVQWYSETPNRVQQFTFNQIPHAGLASQNQKMHTLNFSACNLIISIVHHSGCFTT